MTDAHTTPILNPAVAKDELPLWLVRLDDRGDLLLYVWGGNEQDADDAATEWAKKHGYECREGDVSVSSEQDPDKYPVVLARCHVLTDKEIEAIAWMALLRMDAVTLRNTTGLTRTQLLSALPAYLSHLPSLVNQALP